MFFTCNFRQLHEVHMEGANSTLNSNEPRLFGTILSWLAMARELRFEGAKQKAFEQVTGVLAISINRVELVAHKRTRTYTNTYAYTCVHNNVHTTYTQRTHNAHTMYTQRTQQRIHTFTYTHTHKHMCGFGNVARIIMLHERRAGNFQQYVVIGP